MLRVRVIPVLLFQDSGLYKTIKFKKPIYVGDPINCVRIFNEKEVDELIFLDIGATKNKKTPNLKMIKDIATECFMPFSYGGGVRTIEDAELIFKNGAEKIVLNSILFSNLKMVETISHRFGSQSIVASLDAYKGWGGYSLYSHGGTIKQKADIAFFVKDLENAGAGEIMITSIDRDGTQKGYDIDLLRIVSDNTRLPVIASGGAASLLHMREAVVDGGASAVAAGSMFVFHGKHHAVLITYPEQNELEKIWG